MLILGLCLTTVLTNCGLELLLVRSDSQHTGSQLWLHFGNTQDVCEIY